MSTLLASVAHELNNPLATILLQAEPVSEDVRGGPLAEPTAEIAQAAACCERLVRQFLTLARQHPSEPAAVALNTLVVETVEILAYPFRVDNVRVHLYLDEQLPLLWGDPHQLQQVLINLLTNAQHALRAAPGARFRWHSRGVSLSPSLRPNRLAWAPGWDCPCARGLLRRTGAPWR
jgi:two-component system NtrC family sensor kinase